MKDMYSLFDGHKYYTYQHHYIKKQNISHFTSLDKSTTLCFAMAIVNLMRPEWFKLPCTEPLLKHLICVNNQGERTSNHTFESDVSGCLPTQILRGTKCFVIVYQDANQEEKTLPVGPMKMWTQYYVYDFHEIQFLTEIIKLSPISMNHIQDTTRKVLYRFKRFSETYEKRIILKHRSPPSFQIYKLAKITFPANSNILKCNSTFFVSMMYFCDKQQDCPDKSDEEFCPGTDSVQLENEKESMQTKKTSRDLYLNVSKASNPVKYSTPPISSHNTKPGKQVHIQSKWQRFLTTSMAESFDKKNLFECDLHTEEFHIHETCCYRLNATGFVFPCSNGKHLEMCGNFTCNLMFKCPQYYCIPWDYVCNGVQDCPLGLDEKIMCLLSYPCTNMFKCKHTSLCIHVATVCDGFANCPHKDDEYFCELKYIQCPFLCECLLYGVVCINIKRLLTLPERSYPYIFLHLENVKVQDDNVYNKFPNLMNIEIVNTQFSNICKVWTSVAMTRVSVKHNQITVLQSLCFVNHNHLQAIHFESNGLEYIQEKAFLNLAVLTCLSLRNNSLTLFSQNLLIRVKQLKVLSLAENNLKAVDSTMFAADLFGYNTCDNFFSCLLLHTTHNQMYFKEQETMVPVMCWFVIQALIKGGIYCCCSHHTCCKCSLCCSLSESNSSKQRI